MTILTKTRFALTVLATGLFLAQIGGATPFFSITDLGSLGGDSADACAVNANGQTVGSATDIFGNIHAMYADGSAFAGFATLPTNAADSMASDLNSFGQAIGTQFVDGQAVATMWSADATSGNFSANAIAGAGSYGMAINEEGQATGMLTTANQEGHAFVTNLDGTVTDMGSFAGGHWSAGYDVNNEGEVVGYGMKSNGRFQAFTWSQTDGYVMLGNLGGANSYAMAINDSGETVGHSQVSSGYVHATVWTNETVEDLGTLTGQGNSYSYGVNSQGDVVGYSSSADGNNHAFLYQDGTLLDLNDLIGDNSDWILTEAYDINDSGQIAGSGYLDGVKHAFLITPPAPVSIEAPALMFSALSFEGSFEELPTSPAPEPSTIATMALALALCVVRKRR